MSIVIMVLLILLVSVVNAIIAFNLTDIITPKGDNELMIFDCYVVCIMVAIINYIVDLDMCTIASVIFTLVVGVVSLIISHKLLDYDARQKWVKYESYLYVRRYWNAWRNNRNAS